MRRGAYRILVSNSKGKSSLGKPRRRLEDNIKMNFQEVGLGCMDWTDLVQARNRWRALVKAVMKLQVP